jgi:peptidoglycan hydrolase-like protein with peptidoglycan-binding domain
MLINFLSILLEGNHVTLKSTLFRNDPKLEAAATSDPAHITPGTTGPHVGKIQRALIELDGALISADSNYGPATATAVLAYKKKRNIINTSYQTEADNIVGKMTMASLDAEMFEREGTNEEARIFVTAFRWRPFKPARS